MTAAGLHAAPAQARARAALGVARMTRLYLVSRRIPAALGLLTAAAILLWNALHWRWNIAGGPAARQFVPLTIEAAAAAVIAVTCYGPFGETERAAGRRLPRLRLAAALALSAIAVGALAAGAAGGQLPGGTAAMLRDFAGLAGIGLLSAAALGGAFGWTGPLAYLVVSESALAGTWTTPWLWATRGPHDRGAAACAALVFAAGTVVITIRGGRDRAAGPPG
jgi:hypothetical protein